MDDSFIEWTHEALSATTNDIMDHFRLLGAAGALASIFKVFISFVSSPYYSEYAFY